MTSTWTERPRDRRRTAALGPRRGGFHYCLACRRERASTPALATAGKDIGIEDRAKLRSAALVRFEIARDPERTEGEIARGRSHVHRRRPQGTGSAMNN